MKIQSCPSFKETSAYAILVGALEPRNFMTFHILGRIIPTDVHIFQRGWNHQPEYVYNYVYNYVHIIIYIYIYIHSYNGFDWKWGAHFIQYCSYINPEFVCLNLHCNAVFYPVISWFFSHGWQSQKAVDFLMRTTPVITLCHANWDVTHHAFLIWYTM